MRLTTYLKKSFRDRVVLTAVERSCTIRHVLEQAVASYMAQQNISSLSMPIEVSPDKLVRLRIENCVKITTIISDETRASLELLKRVRGYSISHSLDRAIHWYLWESPEKMKPRRAFEEALFPRLDIPDKAPLLLPPGMPSLDEIKPGSAVLIDSSIVLLAMDSRRLGYVAPRSSQSESLLYAAKNRDIRGFITPFIIDDLWMGLSAAFQQKELGAAPRGVIPTWSNSVEDMTRRLQAFCGADIETLPVIASDLENALQLAKKAPVDAKIALSLAAMHRAVGPDFAFATANPKYVTAGAKLGGVFVPSDLDQLVPLGEDQYIPEITLQIEHIEKPVPKWPVVEAGSD